MKSLGSNLGGNFRTFLKDIVNLRNILLVGMTAGADRLQAVVQHVNQELLALHVAKTATTVVVFKLFKARVVRKVFCKVLRLAESIKISENTVALNFTRILYLKMTGIGEHTLNLLFHLCRVVAKIDAVAKRLAHLGLAVGTGKPAANLVGRKKNLRLYKDIALVSSVKAADNLAALLQHGS